MAIKFGIYTMEAYSYSLNLILIKYYDNLRSKLGNEKKQPVSRYVTHNWLSFEFFSHLSAFTCACYIFSTSSRDHEHNNIWKI